MESCNSIAYVPDSSSNGNTLNGSGVYELNYTVNTTNGTAGDSTPSTVTATPEPVRRRSTGNKVQSKLAEMLKPCNAISLLAGLLGPGMPEYIFSTGQSQTKAEIVINGNRYEAVAQNKKLAKAKAAEQVLRDICFQQLSIRPEQSVTTVNEEQNVEVEPSSDEALLMAHMASFAVHKLLEQWNLPCLLGVNIMPTNARSSTDGIKLRVQLPPNPTSFNPTTLLLYMVPKATFEEVGVTLVSTSQVEYTARVKVGEMYFHGTAKSKRESRMAAAIDACKTLFGVDYDA